MADAETIYSAKAVRERLGISDGMLRRYAIALESVTGELVKQHPRDGRQYTGEQVEALARAKLRVAEKRGRNVETAIRLALGQTEAEAETSMLPEPITSSALVDPKALAAALEPIITPLLTELQALRKSNERLTSEVVGLREDVAVRVLDEPREPSQPAPTSEDKLEGIRESLERLERTQLVEPET
ncbi:MAG: hypothetical protein M3511_14280, partial [Deinococcota bacterium]|nr:hypothetical protein [Deinococcota bacterium]